MDQLVTTTHGLYDTGFMGFGLDFSYSSPPQVTSKHLELFLNATLFDYVKGEFVPTSGITNLKVDTTTKEAVQADLSR